MADHLDKVKVENNWRVVQIRGTGNATIANFVTFYTPVDVRRVEVATAVSATSIKIFISRDGSNDPEQQVLIAQTPPASAGCTGLDYRWLIHPYDIRLSKPQEVVEITPDPGGMLYLETVGGDAWTMTIEVRG